MQMYLCLSATAKTPIAGFTDAFTPVPAFKKFIKVFVCSYSLSVDVILTSTLAIFNIYDDHEVTSLKLQHRRMYRQVCI